MNSLRLALPLLCVSALLGGCDLRPPAKEILTPLPTGAVSIPHWELVHRNRSIRAMALSADGKEGWAVGEGGLIVHYHEGSWSVDENASSLSERELASVWLSDNGRTGWIVGFGTVLQLREGTWTRVKLQENGMDTTFVSISSEGDGTNACMVSANLRVVCFENGVFRISSSSLPPLSSIIGIRPTIPRIFWGANRGPAWAFSSEFANNRINIYHYENEEWKLAAALPIPFQLTPLNIRGAWIAHDQSKGWAVGNRGTLLVYENGKWSLAPQSNSLTQDNLLTISFTPDGSRGWVIGDRGAVLSWDGQKWQLVSQPQFQKQLGATWLTDDGPSAWALTQDGTAAPTLRDNRWSYQPGPETLTALALGPVWCEGPSNAWTQGRGEDRTEILGFSDGQWKVIKTVPKPEAYGFALNRDGTGGWAISAAGFIHYDGKVWSPQAEPHPEPPIEKVRDLRLSGKGDLGLALAGDGRLFRYRQGRWDQDHQPRDLLGKEGILNLWLSVADLSGWADADGRLLRFRQGEWGSKVESPGDGDRFENIVPSEDLEESLAETIDGKIFRFKSGEWRRESDLAKDSSEGLRDVWISPDHRSGWLLGDDDTFWQLTGGRWLQDEQVMGFAAGVRSLCLAPDGTSGWAVGDQGTILRYVPKPLGSAVLLPDRGADLRELKGTYRLRFANDLQPDDTPKIRLVEHDRGGEGLSLTEQEYEIQRLSPREFRLEFKSAAGRLVKSQEGVLHQLRIEARFPHPSLPVIAVFETQPIYLHGRPLWQKTLFGAAAVLSGNLFLFLLAVRARWIRTVVLHPVGSAAIGLIVGKYLLTDWLIRFVLPLKLAMFRDYRLRLAQSSALTAWTGRLYVPPQVSLASPAAAPAPYDEKAWREVFQTLLVQPPRRVWLVLGPSGLGKTALLENWTRLALELGKTPFLIRLRNSLAPKEEAAALMGQFGDVNVTPDVALDLLTGGGFVLLLDGYNEDRTPEVTREFVRQAAKRNLVILTSQFDPGWSKILDVERIHLEPFGREQLVRILATEWVDRVLASPPIAEIAWLPFTAQLLARFITRKQRLPLNELDIYEDLRTGLERGPLLNLEESAWGLFKGNETELSPGPKLPKEFCDTAVDAGLLTRRVREGKDSYRFVHERIHRLFVASYLERQDERPLADWYGEVAKGLGRGYWTDVLDFWGQIKGCQAMEGGEAQKTAYRGFLKKVAEFSPDIFAQRLYPQYDRLCRYSPALIDQDFILWAARELAKAA